ncbi:PA0069 family radical SAM protein [Temperatibacter marinus]|uniref:PA0069 family radical SAM protein n=1 Tax=Temperatibacter marinus TaxID=1456591 RepID=A0AA52EGV1_9PROT|nr:PA0069 family radical SAM protein [Temperatibacter marinus]WND02545.1 PA0069 family radical SAM protein [Temperatibacter marinus]
MEQERTYNHISKKPVIQSITGRPNPLKSSKGGEQARLNREHRHLGRGVCSNRTGRFEAYQKIEEPEFPFGEQSYDKTDNQTRVFHDATKTIITKNDSPDIPFKKSINAYRGCEHGCVYCFARPTHTYLGLSAGLDFERHIMMKSNAAALLEQELADPNYTVTPLAMGTNTDPYQPIEKQHKITRQLLEVLNRFNHPCSIVTKNKLIVRDIDLLSEMAAKGLVKVYVSVTTVDPKLARVLEPRASSPQKRLDAIRLLSDAGIPTGAMFAPIIPAINDMEMEQVLEAVKHAGAKEVAYILLRLPLEVAGLFSEWLTAYFPDRKERVLSRLKAMRGGRVNDPRFKHRMKGKGFEAEMLKRRFEVHCRRLRLNIGEQAHETKEDALNSCPVKFTVPADVRSRQDRSSGQLNLFA